PSDRVPPIIRQGPANHTLAPGSTAQLQCHVIGNPLPSVQWEKDGQRILAGDGRVSLMENGTFQITNLQLKVGFAASHRCVTEKGGGGERKEKEVRGGEKEGGRRRERERGGEGGRKERVGGVNELRQSVAELC
ncbi:hypothetical protein CRUP_011397, partial [Coryphaenoides rupestris]